MQIALFLYIFVINTVAVAVTVCFLIPLLFLVNCPQLSSEFLPFVCLSWDGGREQLHGTQFPVSTMMHIYKLLQF